MNRLAAITILFMPLLASAQYGSMKKLDSKAKGTLFAYFGYNRSSFSKSNIRFVGPGYDFTLKKAVAHDNPIGFDPSVHFNPAKVTLAQYNARIGYYFKKNWAISFGIDHLKYVLDDHNQVYLNGEFDPGVDTVTNWSGVFNEEPIVTDREKFHYQNNQGLNYLRLELTRTDQWLKLGNRNQFILSTNVGIATGGLLSYSDLNFAGRKTSAVPSLSGYGVSVHLAPRLEFFRYLFFQTNLGAGFMHQVKSRTRPNDPSSYVRQAFGFTEIDAVLGFFIYLKPKNACDTCPEW